MQSRIILMKRDSSYRHGNLKVNESILKFLQKHWLCSCLSLMLILYFKSQNPYDFPRPHTNNQKVVDFIVQPHFYMTQPNIIFSFIRLFGPGFSSDNSADGPEIYGKKATSSDNTSASQKNASTVSFLSEASTHQQSQEVHGNAVDEIIVLSRIGQCYGAIPLAQTCTPATTTRSAAKCDRGGPTKASVSKATSHRGLSSGRSSVYASKFSSYI